MIPKKTVPGAGKPGRLPGRPGGDGRQLLPGFTGSTRTHGYPLCMIHSREKTGLPVINKNPSDAKVYSSFHPVPVPYEELPAPFLNILQ